MEKNVPIVTLNVGQFEDLIEQILDRVDIRLSPVSNNKEYVYGLLGIRDLFGVSHVTAQRYKDTILQGAVKQCGRKIIVDKQKAIELFDNYKKY